jgi:4'-phosphopantetheinyl transferase
VSGESGCACLICFASLEQLRPRHLALLSPSERARRERHVRAEDRDRFALGAALLRALVGASTGLAPAAVAVERTCPRCGQPHGRPRLPGCDLHASVTHSGRVAAAAITAAGPVGIDVELIAGGDPGALAGDDPGPLAEAIRAPGEAPARSPREFHIVWTRKEAVLKATGVGLELAMTRVHVSAAERPPALLAYDGCEPPPARMLDLQPAPGYLGCVCVLSAEAVRFECVEAAPLLS